MYFERKRFCFDGFDGKTILFAYFDFPTNGTGVVFEYLSIFVNRCYDFVSRTLYAAVRDKYVSEYNQRENFVRYFYELKIIETLVKDELCSYLILIVLKCGTNVLSYSLNAAVFCRDLMIPPRLIYRGRKSAVILIEDGIPASAEYVDGNVVIKKIVDKKFTIFE